MGVHIARIHIFIYRNLINIATLQILSNRCDWVKNLYSVIIDTTNVKSVSTFICLLASYFDETS